MANEEIKYGVVGGSDKVRMNLWMSESMFKFLQEVSSRDGRTMSDIVRESLRDFIAKDRRTMGDSDGHNATPKLLVE